MSSSSLPFPHPIGQIITQRPSSAPMGQHVDQMELAVLDRHFTLGALYDCRRDAIISGVRLWSPSQIGSLTQSQRDFFMSSTIERDVSAPRKAEILNISTDTKLRLLAGSFTPEGAGKYLTERVHSSRGTRSVTYILSFRTAFEELNLQSPPKVSSAVKKRLNATHIVSGIQYGGKAVFHFEASDGVFGVEDLSRWLSVPSDQLLYASSRSSEASNRAKIENIHVKYFGDFSLNSGVTCIEDALTGIKSLPANARAAKTPQVVYLTALSTLSCLKLPAPEVFRLPKHTAEDAISRVEMLEDAIRVLHDLLQFFHTSPWQTIARHLHEFARTMKGKKCTFEDRIRQILLCGTATSEEEESLCSTTVELDRHYHPGIRFLSEWLCLATEACRTLEVIVDIFSGLKVSIIGSQHQKARFMLEKEDDSVVTAISCPESIFSFPGFRPDAPATLWPSPEAEKTFYADVEKRRAAIRQRPRRKHALVEDQRPAEPVGVALRDIVGPNFDL